MSTKSVLIADRETVSRLLKILEECEIFCSAGVTSYDDSPLREMVNDPDIRNWINEAEKFVRS
jgi:hypothetical protein